MDGKNTVSIKMVKSNRTSGRVSVDYDYLDAYGIRDELRVAQSGNEIWEKLTHGILPKGKPILVYVGPQVNPHIGALIKQCWLMNGI